MRAKGKNKRTRIYQCLEKECKHQFSADRWHDLPRFAPALTEVVHGDCAHLRSQEKRIRVPDAAPLGSSNYRTAWHLCHRIRAAMTQDNLVLTGPPSRPTKPISAHAFAARHARPPNQEEDDVVLGMVERGGGRLKLVPIGDSKSRTMQPLLEKHISEQVGTIYTDEHPIYIFALKRKLPGKHQTIVHKRTYAIGDVHTNTIENAFACSRSGLYGTFHQVSTKHLARYCDEFSYSIQSAQGTRKNVRGHNEELDARKDADLRKAHGFGSIGVLEPRFPALFISSRDSGLPCKILESAASNFPFGTTTLFAMCTPCGNLVQILTSSRSFVNSLRLTRLPKRSRIRSSRPSQDGLDGNGPPQDVVGRIRCSRD